MRVRVTQVRDYSKRGDALPIPNLIEGGGKKNKHKQQW